VNINNPLVSIIVPVFNAEQYLRECLDSLVSQTLKDIEIICVNDGSTDDSLSILEEYASRDNRIIIINKMNTGYGNTMNVGLDRATGDYIGIVESDDFAAHEMFERLYEVANIYGAQIVKSNYFSYKSRFGGEKKFIEVLKDCPYNSIFSPIDEYRIFFATASIWSGIYQRKFLEDYNIRFNETPGASYQDTSFTFKLLICAEKVFLIRDAFLHYRVDNINSSVKFPNKIFCVCDEYEEIERFLSNNLPNMANKLKPLIFALKFRTYRWNYNRLASSFQFAFLMRMSAELKTYYENGFLDCRYWNSADLAELQCIINDPYKYFEDTAKDYHDERLLLSQTLNSKFYKQGFLDSIMRYKNIIIYGAGVVGKKVAEKLKHEQGLNNILCIAVSDKNKNPESVLGIPVYSIHDLGAYTDDSVVIIATKERYQYDIINVLKSLQFKNIIAIDSLLLNGLTDECS